MDGVPIAEAASGWHGPEAVVFTVIGGLAILALALIIRHIMKCDRDTARIHARLDEITATLAELKASVAVIKALEEERRPK